MAVSEGRPVHTQAGELLIPNILYFHSVCRLLYDSEEPAKAKPAAVANGEEKGNTRTRTSIARKRRSTVVNRVRYLCTV